MLHNLLLEDDNGLIVHYGGTDDGDDIPDSDSEDGVTIVRDRHRENVPCPTIPLMTKPSTEPENDDQWHRFEFKRKMLINHFVNSYQRKPLKWMKTLDDGSNFFPPISNNNRFIRN
jgi:hypothetical protein